MENRPKMSAFGEFFYMIFNFIIDITVDILFTIYYISLLAITGVGSLLKSLGESISRIGQWLMKADPMRF